MLYVLNITIYKYMNYVLFLIEFIKTSTDLYFCSSSNKGYTFISFLSVICLISYQINSI